jgi:hypothetical protein
MVNSFVIIIWEEFNQISSSNKNVVCSCKDFLDGPHKLIGLQQITDFFQTLLKYMDCSCYVTWGCRDKI